MEAQEADLGDALGRIGGYPTQLSVIIPCRDAGRVLSAQLDSLARQEWSGEWDVLVVDNGSTDDTIGVAERYRERLPKLRLIDASARIGRQYACNAGARYAGESMVFVDADDEVAPGFVAAIGAALKKYPLVAARIDHVTLNEGWVRDGRSDAQSSGLQDGFGFLPFGSGGTLGMQRPTFQRLGGFSPNMHYAEDVDFCWRAQLAGFPLHYVDDAVLRYRYRPSLSSMYRQHRNFGRASALLFRTYRSRGMKRRCMPQALSEWAMLARGPIRMRSRADAARWLRRLGRCIGRLEGSAQHGVWFP